MRSRAAGLAAVLVLFAGACAEEVPAAAADYLELSARPLQPPASATRLDAAVGAFVGPHFSLGFSAVEVRSDLPPELGGKHAADGYEFVIAYGTREPAFEPVPVPGAPMPVIAAVRVGEQRKVLARQPNSGDSLLVSVRKGQSALLEVLDAGRPLSYNLRTGIRGPENPVGFYRPRVVELGDARTAGKGTVATGEVEVGIDFGKRSCYLQPWTAAAGWAGDHRIFLECTDLRLTVDGPGRPGSFRQPEAFTLDLPGGAKAYAKPSADRVMLFELPDDFAGAELTVDPAGVLLDDNAGPWITPPPSKKVVLFLRG
ncbi:hypothetical protein SAMN05421504_107185 [Amycolatopsis xylanica]|uniref:Uncharacterized protein n=1 Tax=Amycolatopsis xylanica TaxID=589385 RepID=A0A1H3N988_9PSEU|nr:hypothetical protein [Amycolatopsis xylanica]SDY85303.1 hypothetical protein SAMN05421504_107185 [Amycolatopsis xylanica]